MTDFTFQSGHYSPFTNDLATFRDHFIGITLHFLTHFLSEAISWPYIFPQFFAVASTKAGKKAEKKSRPPVFHKWGNQSCWGSTALRVFFWGSFLRVGVEGLYCRIFMPRKWLFNEATGSCYIKVNLKTSKISKETLTKINETVNKELWSTRYWWFRSDGTGYREMPSFIWSHRISRLQKINHNCFTASCRKMVGFIQG